MNSRLRWEHLIGLAGTVGLFAIPFVFVHANAPARYDAFGAGTLLLMVTLVMLWRFKRWQMWLMLAIGGWLIVAPSALHFIPDRPLMWTHEIIGVALLAIAFSTLLDPDSDSAVAQATPPRRRFGSDKPQQD